MTSTGRLAIPASSRGRQHARGPLFNVGSCLGRVGDYSGDRKADALLHHATRGEVWVWLTDGETIRTATWMATIAFVGG